MSFSMLFFVVSVIAAYKFGGYTARNPGVAWACCRDSSVRIWKWLMS